MDWKDVEAYLKQYVGEMHMVEDTSDMVYIGPDLPDEYAHSKYTKILKGTNVKAKANATQRLPEIIEIAREKQFHENTKDKHNKDAKYGWYRYKSKFALPVFEETGEIIRYNVG